MKFGDTVWVWFPARGCPGAQLFKGTVVDDHRDFDGSIKVDFQGWRQMWLDYSDLGDEPVAS